MQVLTFMRVRSKVIRASSSSMHCANVNISSYCLYGYVMFPVRIMISETCVLDVWGLVRIYGHMCSMRLQWGGRRLWVVSWLYARECMRAAMGVEARVRLIRTSDNGRLLRHENSSTWLQRRHRRKLFAKGTAEAARCCLWFSHPQTGCTSKEKLA